MVKIIVDLFKPQQVNLDFKKLHFIDFTKCLNFTKSRYIELIYKKIQI